MKTSIPTNFNFMFHERDISPCPTEADSFLSQKWNVTPKERSKWIHSYVRHMPAAKVHSRIISKTIATPDKLGVLMDFIKDHGYWYKIHFIDYIRNEQDFYKISFRRGSSNPADNYAIIKPL